MRGGIGGGRGLCWFGERCYFADEAPRRARYARQKLVYSCFHGEVGSFAIHGLALAAGFDCTHATSPREQLICRDPVLSDLDRRLGRAYQKRRAVLSPHGAELLQSFERSWLHYIATACPLVVRADANIWQIPKNCLQEKYQRRLNQLAKVGQRLGPFLFNRIDLYAVEPAPDETTPGFYVQHVAYPQIDNPHSAQEDSWNKQNVKVLSEYGTCEGLGDYDTDYEIGYATRRVISVQWVDFFWCHGTPHGAGHVYTQNVVLLPNLRALTKQDVFGPDDRWVVKLRELFWDALGKSGWSPTEHLAKKGLIESSVAEPHHWLFTAEGLEIAFSSYEGGCYTCTPPPVTVPWATLTPLLSRSAVVTPRAPPGPKRGS